MNEDLDGIYNSVAEIVETSQKKIKESSDDLKSDVKDYIYRNNLHLEEKIKQLKASNDALIKSMSDHIASYTDKITQKTNGIDKIVESLKKSTNEFVESMAENIKKSKKTCDRYNERRNALFYIETVYIAIGPLFMFLHAIGIM